MPVKKVPLAQIQPGMILAQQVTDENGRTIMQEGVRITPMHIKRLTKWEIEELAVQSEEEHEAQAATQEAKRNIEEAPPEDRDRMREVAKRVQKRFANVEDNPVMEDMKRLAVRHLVLQGSTRIPGLE